MNNFTDFFLKIAKLNQPSSIIFRRGRFCQWREWHPARFRPERLVRNSNETKFSRCDAIVSFAGKADCDGLGHFCRRYVWLAYILLKKKKKFDAFDFIIIF